MSDNNKTRLYLTLPPIVSDQFPPAMKLLDHLLSILDIACVNLPLCDKGNEQDDQNRPHQQKELISRLQKKRIAVLADITAAHYSTTRKNFEKALENAYNMACDGLHMTADSDHYKRAREVLGPNAIIGVDCAASRHAAMQLGELGADYVAFGAHEETEEHDLNKGFTKNADQHFQPESVLELVDWWQQLFEIPSVALNASDRSQIEDLLQLPADFMALETSARSILADDPAFQAWLATKCPIAEIKS